MNRYLIITKPSEKQKELVAQREKEVKAGLRPEEIQLTGEGKFITAGELEGGGSFMLVECVNPREFLSDIKDFIADAEIRTVTPCPSDCQACPSTIIVPPLRSE